MYSKAIRVLGVAVLASLAIAGSSMATGLIIDATDVAANGAPGVLYNGASGSFYDTFGGETMGSTRGYNSSREMYTSLGAAATNEYALWTFTGLSEGWYSVGALWSVSVNSPTNVTYEIFDGSINGTLRVSVSKNQELAPNDLTIDDGQGTHTWEMLSGWVFVSNGTLTVRLKGVDNASGKDYAVADAIRVDTAKPLIIDATDGSADGSPGVTYNGASGGFSTTFGGNALASTAGYNSGPYRFTSLTTVAASEAAVWTFTGLPSGYYIVHANWPAPSGNRATAVPYQIFDGTTNDTLRFATTKNQESAPNDLTIDDGQGSNSWGKLSAVYVNSGTLTVALKGVDNTGGLNYVVADAVRVVRWTNEVTRIIDATDTVGSGEPGVLYNCASGGFSTTFGGWSVLPKTSSYNSGRYRFTSSGSGASSEVAIWTFTDLPSGYYSVHANWPDPGGNRTTAAPYQIFDGTTNDTLRFAPKKNQEIAANDLIIDDGQGSTSWGRLADSLKIESGTLTVALKGVDNTSGSDYVVADVVRVTDSVAPTGTLIILR